MSEARPPLVALNGGSSPNELNEDATSLRESRALTRLAAGDVNALGDLYDLHHGAVRALARRLLGDTAAAEDLVHDTFLELPEVAGKLRGTGSIRNYVLGIAANLSRHHVRSAKRRRDAMERMGHEPPSSSRSPEADLAREQLARTLQNALDELSHEHRITFVLSEIEERSGPEVAAILGIPEATVRTRIFHAKKRLREILEASR
ncbi:MAG: RNA polymerase sigma factor [Polyangiaceae bacterium]